MSTIAVLGTMDTKGEEFTLVVDLIRSRGHQTLIIDVGTLSPPILRPDISREEVAAAGNLDFQEIIRTKDRGRCVSAMVEAAPHLLKQLVKDERIHGVISLGGGGGTSIATAAMRALPIGIPKVMVSTLASGNTAPYVGVKDIVMFPSIVDIAGINRISRKLMSQAAGAVCGMVETVIPEVDDRPLLAASQFGNTTECVDIARRVLEKEGYEVLVFHATGTGGRTMETLIESGQIDGILDITTTEWADQLVGGVLNAGASRLEAAAKSGTPAIVVPGCLDMVNFNAPDTIPKKFRGRLFYEHNPQITLMRTNSEECTELGRILSEKLNASTGPITLLIPTKAISVISAEGKVFHDPEADQALFDSLRNHLRKDIKIVELDCEINAPVFAEACASELLANLKKLAE
ncbi:MAG TPA: UPF0261 family protein [Verrucomicrobiales bacterium]|nr:UPF0261 family protein [Verrucomicrobiales bacterium]HIL69990.1 UPF0261 family protein [Verrucomicrobiota bacterium]